MTDIDLAIIGSGFGGSLLAMIARRLGLRVVLLERGRHPRFAIGESASPLAGVLLEQLAARYDLPAVAPLASYGTWQRAYPQLGCGVKRGFTYYRQEAGRRYQSRPDRANQLLVAASPNEALADTHWLRADVDQFLVNEALALGVDYLDEVDLQRIDAGADCLTLSGVRSGARKGGSVRLTASRVVDASGPRGALSRLLDLPSGGFAGYPPTQALYSHFVGVHRTDALPDYAPADASSSAPPYPPDAAALHHVFDGGWMWVLRFGNGLTSAGVAVTDACAAELGLAEGAPAWARLLSRYPSLAAQFADARAVREFTWMPRLAWRSMAVAGDRWAMLPSAAAFVDPLFSTGIPLTLLGVERIAADLAAGRWPQRDYSVATLREADQAARFVAGCYAGFRPFAAFTAYSMIYFASASHAEAARRFGVRGYGFLGVDHPCVAAAVSRLSPAVLRDAHAAEGPSIAAVARAIDGINIAGLADAAKRNWYGVDFEDTARAAHKLGMTPEAVRARSASFMGGGTVS